MAEKYLIRVTAGPSYDINSHVQVPVNDLTPVHVASDLFEADLNVRVHNYRGLPRDAPKTSPYFQTELHRHNGDQYSIALRFRLKRPPRSHEEAGSASRSVSGDNGVGIGGASGSESEGGDRNGNGEGKSLQDGVPATDLQFGNDFDHPIRDRLPPGFNTALNIVKWWIDPGLDGDAYADVPHLYGPALSSFNTVHVGEGEHDPEKGGLWFEEGGDDDGMKWRSEVGAPDDAKARMKWALKQDSKERWIWEYNRTYGVDFFNPYIDFDAFALKLPGFNLPIIKYWDGQGLRYVLRNRATGQVYLVVLFTLHLAEDINQDGTLKPAALQALAHTSGGLGKGKPILEGGPERDEDGASEDDAIDEARQKLSDVDLQGKTPTNDDDVD